MLCFLLSDQQGPLLASVPSLSVASVPPVSQVSPPVWILACMALSQSSGPGLRRLALSVLVRGEPEELPASPPCLLQRGTASGVCATWGPRLLLLNARRSEHSWLNGLCVVSEPGQRAPDPMQPLLSVSVKRYIRKGIPLEHRARIWMGVSGAQAQMDQNPGYYQRLLQGEHDDRLEEAIRTGEPPRRGCGVGSPPGQSRSRGNIVQEAPAALKWKFYFSEGKPKLKHSQGENSGFPCFCEQQVGTGARAGPGLFRGELEGGRGC